MILDHVTEFAGEQKDFIVIGERAVRGQQVVSPAFIKDSLKAGRVLDPQIFRLDICHLEDFGKLVENVRPEVPRLPTSSSSASASPSPTPTRSVKPRIAESEDEKMEKSSIDLSVESDDDLEVSKPGKRSIFNLSLESNEEENEHLSTKRPSSESSFDESDEEIVNLSRPAKKLLIESSDEGEEITVNQTNTTEKSSLEISDGVLAESTNNTPDARSIPKLTQNSSDSSIVKTNPIGGEEKGNLTKTATVLEGTNGRVHYTREEDRLLARLVRENSELSPNGQALYRRIAKEMPGRTIESLRSRYLRIIRKRGIPIEDDDCPPNEFNSPLDLQTQMEFDKILQKGPQSNFSQQGTQAINHPLRPDENLRPKQRILPISQDIKMEGNVNEINHNSPKSDKFSKATPKLVQTIPLKEGPKQESIQQLEKLAGYPKIAKRPPELTREASIEEPKKESLEHLEKLPGYAKIAKRPPEMARGASFEEPKQESNIEHLESLPGYSKIAKRPAEMAKVASLEEPKKESSMEHLEKLPGYAKIAKRSPEMSQGIHVPKSPENFNNLPQYVKIAQRPTEEVRQGTVFENPWISRASSRVEVKNEGDAITPGDVIEKPTPELIISNTTDAFTFENDCEMLPETSETPNLPTDALTISQTQMEDSKLPIDDLQITQMPIEDPKPSDLNQTQLETPPLSFENDQDAIDDRMAAFVDGFAHRNNISVLFAMSLLWACGGDEGAAEAALTDRSTVPLWWSFEEDQAIMLQHYNIRQPNFLKSGHDTKHLQKILQRRTPEAIRERLAFLESSAQK